MLCLLINSLKSTVSLHFPNELSAMKRFEQIKYNTSDYSALSIYRY